MPRSWFVLVLCALGVLALPRRSGSDPFTCATTDSVAAAQEALPDTFHVHRPRLPQDLSHRDLEFFWHARPTWDPGLTPQVTATLNNFGATLSDITGLNPFGIDVGAFQLVYEYFRRVPVPYGTSPGDTTATTAIVIGKGTAAEEYPTRDRAHLDLYVIDSSIPGVAPGRYASAFVSPLEDISTGHPALSDSALGLNSIHIRGPVAAQRHDLDGTGWTAPGRVRAVGAMHELQHSLPDGSELDPYTELFSAGAEAIVGHQDPVLDPAEFEVPYTWPLTAHVNSLFTVPPATPGVGRNAGDNYQGRTAFAAYLAYNFRGADTTATLPAIEDDLLHRWSRQPRFQHTLAGLRDLLGDDSCATCATRPYFQGLDNASRLGLLIHNWRIANYVNNSTLADGQYGYPPQFGFSPAANLKAWQSFRGGTTDDNVSIPPEVVLTSANRLSEVSLAGERSWVGAPYPMMLQPLGSEYWVVRADPSAWTTGQDLVVRVTPESFYRFVERKALRVGSQTLCITSNKSDGRLVCSVIGYSPPDNQVSAGQLWQHPEWAVAVLPPKWVDVDSMAGPLEFVLPGFGSTVKAAIVVLSLADGPAQRNYAISIGNGYLEALPYRLNLALRRVPYQTVNPWPQASGALASDDEVVWSPGGDSLLFTRTSGGVPKLYRKLVGGSAILPLLPASPTEERQTCPAWSPRGDYVAFTKQAGAGAQQEVWVYNQRLGTDLRKLVARSGAELCAEFQPNGQRLAYVWQWTTGDTITEIGRIKLDGTSDVALYRREGSATLSSLRWSSDGKWIYFLANDSLYAVRTEGPTQGQVVAHPDLSAGNTHSFDLAPSTGPLLLEQAASPTSYMSCVKTIVNNITYWCEGCPGPTTHSEPVRRLALRNTANFDTQARFYQTGADYYRPRWSPDGTRIAYSTNQNGPPDRDIYIGQVSFNHAPLLHDVAQFHEMDVYAHVPFSYDFSASDSDGEAITFQAVYLPDSATFHPTTGLFSWPNPKQNGADDLYFIVFRALDPSGGVHSYVTRFRVLPQAPGGGGCPFVDVSTADGWITDNSILGRSRTGELGVDSYRLKLTPAVRDGHIRLRLRENEQELTTLDQVRLLAVDHAPSLSMMSAGGELYWGERVPAWRVTTSRGEDITSLVSGQPGSMGWRGSPGDTVLVEMTDPATGRFGLTGTQDGGGGAGEGSDKEVEVVYDPSTGGGRYAASPTGDETATPAALTDATWLDRTGIRVQVPDGAGGWQDLTHWYPRANRDDSYFPGLTHDTARLMFVGQHGLSFFGRLRPKTGAVNQTTLEPLAATHTRLGDARNAVGGTAEATELAPGDSLYLEFAAPPPVEGMVREYILVTRGVYTSNVGAARLQPQAPKVPARYALLQNVPNPFAGTTAIQFELPRAERVKLEVFDLLGRRVRTLADGEWPAGYHAVEWDRTGDSGARLRAGVYLYRLTAGSFRDKKKMVIGVR